MRFSLTLPTLFGLVAAPLAGQVPLRSALSEAPVLNAADSAGVIIAVIEGLRDTIASTIGKHGLQVDPGPYPQDSASTASLIRAAATYQSAKICLEFLPPCGSPKAAQLDIVGVAQLSAGRSEVTFWLWPKRPPTRNGPLAPSSGSRDWMWERSLDLLLGPPQWPDQWTPLCWPCAKPNKALVYWTGERWQLESTEWWRPPPELHQASN